MPRLAKSVNGRERPSMDHADRLFGRRCAFDVNGALADGIVFPDRVAVAAVGLDLKVLKLVQTGDAIAIRLGESKPVTQVHVVAEVLAGFQIAPA